MTFRMFRSVSHQATRDQHWRTAADAIVRRDVQSLKRLLDTNWDPNFTSLAQLHSLLPDVRLRQQVYDYTQNNRLLLNPLHLSILLKNKAAADMLLAHGADQRVPVARPHIRTVCYPIHLAVICNDTAILKSLIDHAAGNSELLNQRDVYYLSALDQALKSGARECANILIQSGVAIAMDENNASLLTVCGLISEACGTSDFTLLHMILDCDYAAGGDILSTFLTQMCIDDECEEAIEAFNKIVKRCDFTATSYSGLERNNYMHLAAGQQSVRMMEKLSAMGVKLEVNLCGENPLHFAVGSDHNVKESIQFLLSLGYDINQVDASAATPLISAIDCGNSTAILCLLEAGCACPVSTQGYTYLHFYCLSGGTDIAVLNKLTEKCDINAVSKLDWTALHLLVNSCAPNAQQPVIAAMNELIRLGADPLIRNSAGDTILTIAIVRDLVDIIYELIGPSISRRVMVPLLNTGDALGLTPLQMAIISPLIPKQTVIGMISRGADVNARDNDGRTTLFYLLATEYATQEEELAAGRRVSSPRSQTSIVLRFRNILSRRNIFSFPMNGPTDRFGMWDLLDYMLDHTDVDINCRLTSTNDTPLNIAFFKGEYDLMRKLLISGADVVGLSGARFTLQPGMLQMCKILDQYGYDDFDPVLFKLREVQNDKYRMTMISASERQEIYELDEFLESRKKRVPELSRMTANAVRRMHDRHTLKQMFQNQEVKKYIWK